MAVSAKTPNMALHAPGPLAEDVGSHDLRLAGVVETIRAAVPRLAAVYLFGSMARHEDRPDSDIDLAFLAEQRMDPLLRFELQQTLSCQLDRHVDLVDLRAVPTVMRMQVIASGTSIAIFDRKAVEEFEMYAYSDYARLNEERAPILKRILAEGSVYGR